MRAPAANDGLRVHTWSSAAPAGFPTPSYGIFVRGASICGMIYIAILLFSSNYPGPHVPFWQYFGAALDHLVLALCFATFAIGNADQAVSLPLAWSEPAPVKQGLNRRSVATLYE